MMDSGNCNLLSRGADMDLLSSNLCNFAMAPPKKKSGGIGGFVKNLFGFGSSNKESCPPPPSMPEKRRNSAKKQQQEELCFDRAINEECMRQMSDEQLSNCSMDNDEGDSASLEGCKVTSNAQPNIDFSEFLEYPVSPKAINPNAPPAKDFGDL